nr:uncharacterized protein LOC104099347 [Nicotiana tomentosiformis]
MRLGYVQESNDYKLLKVPLEPIWIKNEGAYLAWVYTLSSGLWKTVPFTLLSQTVAYGPEISLNSFVYWLATSDVECIICFDLINDEFKLLDVPDDRGFHRTNAYRKLMVLRGYLVMMVYVDDGFKDTEIWVMNTSYNNGIQQNSWTKKFIIDLFL